MKASDESIYEFDLNESSVDDIVYFYLYSIHLFQESSKENFNKAQEELEKNGGLFESDILRLNPTERNEVLIDLLDTCGLIGIEYLEASRINGTEYLEAQRLTGFSYLLAKEYPKFKNEILKRERNISRIRNKEFNKTEASEIAYDLYVDAYNKYQILKKTKRIKLTCKVSTYLFSVGMNLYKNKRRKLNIEEKHIVRVDDLAKYDAFDKDIILSGYLPINTKDLYDFIRLFINECHQLAVMKLRDEFSWNYIAQTLNQNVGTIQNHFSDCKKKIIKTLRYFDKI